MRLARTDAFEDIVVATDILAVAVTATQMVTRTAVMAATVLPLTVTEAGDRTEEVATVEVLEVTRCPILELVSRRKNGVRWSYLNFNSGV